MLIAIAVHAVLVAAGAARAQVIAYDEFDGRCRGGWKQPGLGEWRGTGGVERVGAFVTTRGNDWRALDHVVDGVVWYAVTLRMAAPIEGYVSVVPADTARGQFTELGFNSAYGTRVPLWTGSGVVKAEALGDGTEAVTLLQRYDFASDRWSAWGAKGDGLALLAESPQADLRAVPFVRDAMCPWKGLGWLYLSKGSAQEIAIERVAFARTAREALTPIIDPTTSVEGVDATMAAGVAAADGIAGAAGAVASPISDGARRDLAGPSSPLRAGDVISFFGDSITWQGGFVDLLSQGIGAGKPGLDVRLVKRGINGGKSTDLLKGCKELYGCTQPPLAHCMAQDHSTVAVIVIGINDVWHGEKGNPLEVYEKTLNRLVLEAQSQWGAVVVGTPLLIGETARGGNPFDAQLDQYAAIALEVARKRGAVGVPLRDRAFEQLARRNAAQAENGVLTYDGVHLTELGNEWLAEELAGGIATALRNARQLALVPWPKEVVRAKSQPTGLQPLYALESDPVFAAGSVSVGRPKAFFSEPTLAPIAGALNPLWRAAMAGSDRTPQPFDLGEPTPVELRLDPALSMEEYRLEIGDQLRISGGSARAVAWGGATLAQLLESNSFQVPSIEIDDVPSILSEDFGTPGRSASARGNSTPENEAAGVFFASSLPALTIRDAPDCNYRGLLVDVARQPHRIETLRQLVVVCWFAKVPWLQLHLTDDQAFTFPSRMYPELARAGHSFTHGEIEELVQFAESLGVTIVPELDMPGHCGALIRALPELFQAHKLHHATIDFAKPAVVEAMKILIDELIELFPTSPWIHLGGDECDLAHVDENPNFKAAYARHGVADAHGLYLWFLGEMDRHVKSRGRKTIVWEGFGHGAEPQLPRDVTVMAYEALYHLPGCLVDDGYPVINASWRPLYVVNDRKWEPAEIHGWNRLQWNHFVEGFPAFGGLAVPPTDRILGGQLCSWEQPDSIELESLRRRLPAMSESLWNEHAARSPEDFAWRLARFDAKLSVLLEVSR